MTVKIPSGWFDIGGSNEFQKIVAEILPIGGQPKVARSITIDLLNSTLTRNFQGRVCRRPDNPSEYKSLSELDAEMERFAREGMCPGIRNDRYLDVGEMENGQLEEGVWRSNKYIFTVVLHSSNLKTTFFFTYYFRCHFLMGGEPVRCCECTRFLDALRQSKYRKLKAKISKTSSKPLHYRKQSLAERLLQQKAANKTLRDSATYLRNRVKVGL